MIKTALFSSARMPILCWTPVRLSLLTILIARVDPPDWTLNDKLNTAEHTADYVAESVVERVAG